MRLLVRIHYPALFFACLSLIGCASTGSINEDIKDPTPFSNETYLAESMKKLGDLLLAYPVRRPFRLDESIVIGVNPILNYSGEDGLPPDFSTVLTTTLGEIGEPIVPKPAVSIQEREATILGRLALPGPEPALTIQGSVTEGEKRITSEFNAEMDLLFSGSSKNAVDVGGSRGKGFETWTLTLDLHLVSGGLVVEAVSHRVNVVRRGETSSYGVFFRGSGIGYRGRELIAQSKSQALRIAAQQSVIVLLGRYFRVPYWRVIPGAEPDPELIHSYREILRGGEAPEDFRLLLFANGLDIDLNSYTFTDDELRAVAELKQRLGLPANLESLDLAMHLWLNAPYSREESRIRELRRHLRLAENPGLPDTGPLPPDSLAEIICGLRPGQQLYVPVPFEYGRWSLSEPAKSKIDRIVEALELSCLSDGDWWFELRGHSDEQGDPGKNQELSERRATRVRSYLEQSHSVPRNRIASAGFGSTEPAVEEAKTPEEHSQNRRVEVLLVAGEGPTVPADSESFKGNGMKNETDLSSLFPPEQWPLPRGVVLPSKLVYARYSTISTTYPQGKLSELFTYYSVRLKATESDLFSEVTFFFRDKDEDPLVAWVGLRCRNGVGGQLLTKASQAFPVDSQTSSIGGTKRWSNLEGYDLIFSSDLFCLRIEPVRP